MPRSSTVWAAALVLASFSGSGPLLTTAEAMPAPGPQQTQGRPRYYFARHVKRQIVTNGTAPAEPTPPAKQPKESTPELLPSPKDHDLTSLVNSMFHGDPEAPVSVPLFISKSVAEPSTVNPPSSKVDLPRPPPSTIPEDLITSSPPPRPSAGPSLEESTPATSNDAEKPLLVGLTSKLPEIIGAPTSVVRSLFSRSDLDLPLIGTTVVPNPLASPTSDATSADPATPDPATQPSNQGEDGPGGVTSAEPKPSSPIDDLLDIPGQNVGATGTSPDPDAIVSPTPAPADDATPSSSEAPALLAPFIVSDNPVELLSSVIAVVPEPTPDVVVPTGILPSNIILPTGGLLSSVLDPVLPDPTQNVVPTGILPSNIILPTGDVLSSILDPVLPEPTPDVVPTGILPSNIVLPTGDILSSLLPDVVVPTGVLPSNIILPTGGVLSSILDPLVPEPTPDVVPTGILPSIVVLPTGDVLPSIIASVVPDPLQDIVPTGVLPSNIVLPSILASELPLPTPDLVPTGILPSVIVLPTPDLLASLIASEIPTLTLDLGATGILPSIIPLPTSNVPFLALPTSGIVIGITTALGLGEPTPTPSGLLPLPILSSIVPDLPGLLSSLVSEIPPTAVPVPISNLGSAAASFLPTPTAAVPSLPIVVPSTGALPTPTETGVPASVTPIDNASASGILPSGAVSTAPATLSGSIPVSEVPPTTIVPPSVANATAIDSATIAIPTIPTMTDKPTPVISLPATATDSQTALVIGSSIIREPTSLASPSATVSGIPASLPKMIAPPGGVPTDMPQDSFMGQVCFKWPLNFPFVSANDGGNQIFHFLPQAIANGLNISTDQVTNFGLKPLDTTAFQGFITTLALFTIPKDLQSTLSASLRNPADPFWHNEDPTVNDLTNLINTACPLTAGKLPADGASSNNFVVNPGETSSGGSGDGGAIGGDIGASRKVNSTSALVAGGAIVGAMAYGAAMFFVARRYRNKRMAHRRTSSVPSTRRMTYGSFPGGATAWMHGARNGRMTPGSRGSQFTSSSQGRSIRTQQISAPVMAENSLGWN